MSIKIRVLLSVFICFALLIYGPVPFVTNAVRATATSEETLAIGDFVVSPMMMYINRTFTGIAIDSSGKATATGSVSGYQGITTSVWIYLYLERYIGGTWQIYDSWGQSFNNYYGTLVGYAYVPHGYYYRVRGSYYAFTENDYEHIYGYSSIAYY